MSKHPRGDVTVTINGEDYVLEPKFKAIAAAEQATGKGLIEMMGAVASLQVGVVATVLFHALRANEFTGLSYDDVGEAVMESIGQEDQPLVKAAIEYVNAFFPKKQAGGKKPTKAKIVTG
ncbi:MAG: GTA-gp10 family protein [Acetobacteraceae bacterium]